MSFVFLADKLINGCSPDKQEDRGRREVELKPVELALTEEHMSCVTGMDQRLRLLTSFLCQSDKFKTAVIHSKSDKFKATFLCQDFSNICHSL